MTRTRDYPRVHLTLTPYRIPRTPLRPARVGGSGSGGSSPDRQRESDRLSRNQTEPDIQEHHWVIYPGEPSEILSRFENTSDYRVQLALAVEGDFPTDWCTVVPGEAILSPRGRADALLSFRVGADFFEREDRAIDTRRGLVLDYTGQIRVGYRYLAIDSTEPPLPLDGTPFPERLSLDFQLHIRPWSLYLDFLPEIYREIDFIGRLLHVFERAFEPDVEILESMWAYLDPALAPETMLPFLSHWVGWQLLPNWSLSRQRVLVKRAIELHRLRGTRRGLSLYLHLYTGLPLEEGLPEERRQIVIEEDLDRKLTLGRSRLGQDTYLGGGKPFHLRVKLRPPPALAIDPALIHEIVDQVKPAFCTHELIIETDTTNRP